MLGPRAYLEASPHPCRFPMREIVKVAAALHDQRVV